jgi:hypothetical protein
VSKYTEEIGAAIVYLGKAQADRLSLPGFFFGYSPPKIDANEPNVPFGAEILKVWEYEAAECIPFFMHILKGR